MATSTFQKFLGNLSGNKNVKNLVSDFQKLSKELRQKGAEINRNMKSNKTVSEAKAQYKKIMAKVANSQKQLDKELDKALGKIRKSAADVEKNLQFYKKKAAAQSKKLEKSLKAQTKATSKKKTSRKASKKTSRKASKKTSRKSS